MTLRVKAISRSAESEIVGIAAPLKEGRANGALCDSQVAHFGVRRVGHCRRALRCH